MWRREHVIVTLCSFSRLIPFNIQYIYWVFYNMPWNHFKFYNAGDLRLFRDSQLWRKLWRVSELAYVSQQWHLYMQ